MFELDLVSFLSYLSIGIALVGTAAMRSDLGLDARAGQVPEKDDEVLAETLGSRRKAVVVDDSFSDFNFWRTPIPNLDDL